MVSFFQKGGAGMELVKFSAHNYGAFDSQRTHHREGSGKPQLATVYEFEFYTEDCDGGLLIDGEHCPVRSGMVSLAKPGQVIQPTYPYKCYFVNLNTADPELKDLFDHLPNSFSIWNMDRVIAHLQEMIALGPIRTLAQKMALQSHACGIITILSKYRQSQEQTARNAFAHQKTLLMIDAFMRSNISEALTLSDLAKRCSLDPTYFHKLYTAAFGKTPAQRLLYFRIRAAQVMLLEGKQSLSDVAAQCGFSSQTYFCYKFRQVTGKTPTQYRDEMLSKQKNE